jgi:hypothetical protein
MSACQICNKKIGLLHKKVWEELRMCTVFGFFSFFFFIIFFFEKTNFGGGGV